MEWKKNMTTPKYISKKRCWSAPRTNTRIYARINDRLLKRIDKVQYAKPKRTSARGNVMTLTTRPSWGRPPISNCKIRQLGLWIVGSTNPVRIGVNQSPRSTKGHIPHSIGWRMGDLHDLRCITNDETGVWITVCISSSRMCNPLLWRRMRPPRWNPC